MINQSDNSLAEKYPVNAVATSQQMSPDLWDNDDEVVVGVAPPANGTFVALTGPGASVNTNQGIGDDEHTVTHLPSSSSPNHVPVPIDNKC